MEEATQYEQFTKEELIQIIMDLKKEIEALRIFLTFGEHGSPATKKHLLRSTGPIKQALLPTDMVW